MSNFESIRAEMKKDLQDPLENLQKTLAQCNYLEESAKKTLADCEHIIVGDGTVTNPWLEAKATAISDRISALKEWRFKVDDFSTENVGDDESIQALQAELWQIKEQIGALKKYFQLLKNDLAAIAGHGWAKEKLFTKDELGVLSKKTSGLSEKILTFDPQVTKAILEAIKKTIDKTIDKKTITKDDLRELDQKWLKDLLGYLEEMNDHTTQQKNTISNNKDKVKKKKKQELDKLLSDILVVIKNIHTNIWLITEEIIDRNQNYVEMPLPSQKYIDAKAETIKLQGKDKKYSLFTDSFQEVVQQQRAEIARIDAEITALSERGKTVPKNVSKIENDNKWITDQDVLNKNAATIEMLKQELAWIPSRVHTLKEYKAQIMGSVSNKTDSVTTIVDSIDLTKDDPKETLNTLLNEYGYTFLLANSSWLTESVSVRKKIPAEVQAQKKLIDVEQKTQDAELLVELQKKQEGIRREIAWNAGEITGKITEVNEEIKQLELEKQSTTDVASLQDKNINIAGKKAERKAYYEDKKRFLSQEKKWLVWFLQAEKTSLALEKTSLESSIQQLCNEAWLDRKAYTDLTDLPAVTMPWENSLQSRMVTQKWIGYDKEKKYNGLLSDVLPTAVGNKKIEIMATMAELKKEKETAEQSLLVLEFEQSAKKDELKTLYTQWEKVNTNLSQLEMYILQHQLEGELIQKSESYRQAQSSYNEIHQQSVLYTEIYARNVEWINTQEQIVLDAMSLVSVCKNAYWSIKAWTSTTLNLWSHLLTITENSPIKTLISWLSWIPADKKLSSDQLEIIIVALWWKSLLSLIAGVTDSISDGFIGSEKNKLEEYYETVDGKKLIKWQKSAEEYKKEELRTYRSMIVAQQEQDTIEQRKKEVDKVVWAFTGGYTPLALKKLPVPERK